ncbi:MarR family winged helix-turn-helix transcriptional regulator [Halobacillus amylolyticus]|uniref:MarR family transcriptional regulator n=1 Tax=Halobacillus amylolyticus TaxID=2932259 RepID=A0ABY4H9P4_9BACI|nr:MarR family transcriptional regulator [Halobacillus amylolyticus]UOR11601.1 MarR family transcriptional regulator [Halobacillus amylolyticus]
MNKRLDEAVDLFKDVMIYGTERIIKSIEHEIYDLYSPEQIHMLQILSKVEKVSPGRLAELQGVHKSAVSNRVKKLSQNGLVKVIDSKEDQRGKTISLTDKGRDVIHQSNELISHHIEDLLSDELKDSEIDEFIRIFNKVRTILKVEDEMK